ncbi:hypothetical protein MLD38_016919 [Melastoma candidum]|uniref:Uncharacterized protein n=1 Tax=Melastoma candidum TaxID=119954 RepID=A0ACB9QNV6_9MYRT|nr:hypothetical protein MLD38_016919 [Melastoma candidum]
MSSFMRKNLSLCFSKAKCLPPLQDLEDEDDGPCSTSNPTSVLLDALSSANRPPSSPSSSYVGDSDSDSLPDLTTVYASKRFFFSSPGQSNSIVESCPEDKETACTGGVAVWKYSRDPRGEFRKSMQEMVDAREVKDVKEDWDYLHELLLCYLRLNPKHTHKFIIGAFTDLIMSLMIPKAELGQGWTRVWSQLGNP